MSRWLYLLLLSVPVTVIAESLHASSLVIFILAALGLVPLASLIGLATEALAERVGHRLGGLLNATFGNAAEIIIGLSALAAGLPEVVRASIAGSIIGNTLLVLGLSMLVGGWRHRRQVFQVRTAGHYAAMMALAVIGMAIPSLLATVGENTRPGAAVVKGDQLHQLSIGVAFILLLCYVAYIAYSVFGLRAVPDDNLSPMPVSHETHSSVKVPVPSQRASRGALAWVMANWKTQLWLPIGLLAVVTAITVVMSEVLVGTIEPLTHQVGLNPFFVGLIIVPLVGNAAEHFSAITFANKNQMEVSLAISAGSSIQNALLVAPVLVLAGVLMGSPLDLNFSLLEVTLLALVAGLFSVISLDGESTWLEGLLLCAFYVMLAVGTYFPTSFL